MSKGREPIWIAGWIQRLLSAFSRLDPDSARAAHLRAKGLLTKSLKKQSSLAELPARNRTFTGSPFSAIQPPSQAWNTTALSQPFIATRSELSVPDRRTPSTRNPLRNVTVICI
jgi:hypothetical protein